MNFDTKQTFFVWPSHLVLNERPKKLGLHLDMQRYENEFPIFPPLGLVGLQREKKNTAQKKPPFLSVVGKKTRLFLIDTTCGGVFCGLIPTVHPPPLRSNSSSYTLHELIFQLYFPFYPPVLQTPGLEWGTGFQLTDVRLDCGCRAVGGEGGRGWWRGLMGDTGETTERIVLLCQNWEVQRRGREVLSEKKENI